MYPLDGSSSHDFSGIDFAIYACAPGIYDIAKLEDQVAETVNTFFGSRALPVRRCGVAGFGTTTGAPPFWEFVLWVHENWESLEKLAHAMTAFAAGLVFRWRRLRSLLNNRVLDPHRPSVIVEVAARTKGDHSLVSLEGEQSFSGLLSLLPDLNTALREAHPNQRFTIRALDLRSNAGPRHALFKVESITASDVARIVKYFRKFANDSDVCAALLYRQFGLIPRIIPARGSSQFMGLIMRSIRL